jgi:ribonucleoside-triphosphate reductase
MDKKLFGEIPNVTDRDFYTNSFHIPVYYTIPAYKKIELEAPYHPFTNAGHITYIEMDGSPSDNLEAFEEIIRHMKECGVGYGSINHPVDRDPVCGFLGIINDTCPQCGRSEDDGLGDFTRVRRVTGYLATLDRFNDAKLKEEKARVKHNYSGVNYSDIALI